METSHESKAEVYETWPGINHIFAQIIPVLNMLQKMRGENG